MTTITSVTSTVSGVTVSAGQIYEVFSGGVMSGTTVNSGGLVVGVGGVLSAGTSLTTNAGEIGGDLTIVGNVDNTGLIAAAAPAANSFVDMLITGGTVSGPGGLGALATSKGAAAFLEISDETVSGGTLLAAGKATVSGYAQISIDDSIVSGATLETTGGGIVGVFGGHASGTTPVSTTIDNATIVKNSLIFDDGILTLNGGTAQSGVTFWDKNGLLTLSGMSFGNGDFLSASNSGRLNIDNSVNTISAAAVVEATDNSDATLSGGLANAGVVWALASGGQGTTANVTIAAGSNAVTNSRTGIIEAESLAGYVNSAGVEIDGTGPIINSGGVVAFAQGFHGTAYVSLDGGSLTNTNSGAIESLAASNSVATAIIEGVSGVTNSGIMMASASTDAGAYLGITISGGTVSNTKTIEALAPNTGEAALQINDSSGSGTLVNAKGATILASANLNSEIYQPFPAAGLYIDIGSSIVNSGTIAETLSKDSYGEVELSTGGSIVNAGNISATASGDSQLDEFIITPTSSFVNSATGTVAFAASNDSFAYGEIIVSADGGSITNRNVIKATATAGSELTVDILALTDSGGSIVNAGTIETTATGGSTAYMEVEAVGSGSTVTNSKLIEASASGAGSLAGIALGGEDDATGSAIAVNDTGGTLEAAAAAGGMAYLDIGSDNGASITGGTLKTTGAAALGVFSEDDDDSEAGSATSVTIEADSNIVAFGFGGDQAMLVLSDIVNSIAPGTTVEAAYDGVVDIYGNVTNGGTIAAVGGSANFAPGGAYSGYGAVAINAGEDAVTNTGTMVASASDSTLATFSISAGSVTNAKTMAAIAQEGSADFTIDGNTSTGVVVSNTGIIEASGNKAVASVNIENGATIINAKTIEALASDTGAFVNVIGSASIFTNSGTMLASAANDGLAVFRIDGGSVTNAAGKTIEALANANDAAVEILIGSDGNTGNVTNFGTITGSSVDGTADISIDGGTILNAAKGIVEVFATSASNGGINIYASGGTAGSVTNSGAMLASANLDDSATGINIEGGGAITNAAGATIKVFASNEAVGSLDIIDSGGTGGTIYNSGIIAASAGNSSDLYVEIDAGGGSIVNTNLIEIVATGESYAKADIGGSSTVNSGTIEAIGGPDSAAEVFLGGTVTNSTSGIISASGDGSIWLDDDTTIVGGMLRTSGSAAAVIVGSAGVSGTIASATIAKGTQVFAESGGTLMLGNGDVILSGAVVDAYGSGTIVVAGGAVITNSGTLLAGDHGPGTITVSGTVMGPGGVTVGESGTVNVVSGGTASVVFGGNDDGTLVVADSAGATSASTVTVYGFGGVAGEFPAQLIDLGSVAYTTGFSATYSVTSASADPFLDQGTVTVTSGGSQFAVIDVVGDYMSNSFNVVSATNDTVAIDDPTQPYEAPPTLASTGNTPAPSTGASSAALLGNYMASLFASAEGQVGTQTTDAAQTQTLLAHPHAT